MPHRETGIAAIRHNPIGSPPFYTQTTQFTLSADALRHSICSHDRYYHHEIQETPTTSKSSFHSDTP
ncbi:hypothetical protein METHP14_880018 [Pseudomonas sp. P14-2025]